MSASSEPHSDEAEPAGITVRRLAHVAGIASRDIRRAVRVVLGGRPVHTLSIVIVDDDRMAELHGQFLGESGPTDVLAFDLRDDRACGPIEGEIVVSAETVIVNARRFRQKPSRELLRCVIHGTLHLLGYDDHAPRDRQRMRRAENRVLAGLSQLPSPGRKGYRRHRRTTGSV